jgi:CBS domain-containing protein
MSLSSLAVVGNFLPTQDYRRISIRSPLPCQYRQNAALFAGERLLGSPSGNGSTQAMIVMQILKSKGATVTAVPATEPVNRVAVLLHEARIGSVLVHHEALVPIGILSERDIVRGIAESGVAVMEAPVRSLMTEDFLTCTPDDHIDKLMQVVTEHRVRHLPVIENGHLAGIVSIGDLVKARIGELESEGEALRTYISAGA